MKFEIDDKTGMIGEESYFKFDTSGKSYTSFKDGIIITAKLKELFDLNSTIPDSIQELEKPMTSKQLEEILQAVKKTQEKLVNRQIQEVQDSKNPEIYETRAAPKKVRPTLESQKIEQNQKIVNELLSHYKHSHSSDYDLRSFVEEIIKTATGKDIKDLDNNFKSKSEDTMNSRTDKDKQNQKIVDFLISNYNRMPDAKGSNDVVFHLKALCESIIESATGKDIKDL